MTSIDRAPVRSAPSHDSTRPATWKVGATMAGIAGIASFQPSLLPRSGTQQAVATLASMALGYGVGAAANIAANRIDEHSGLDATGSRLALAGAGGAAALAATLALRGRPGIPLELLRTSAGVIGAGAVAGAALIGEQALVDRVDDHVPGGATAAHAAIIGAAALGTGALLLGRTRATAVTREAEAAYLAQVGGVQGTSKNIATFDPARFAELSRLRGEMTTVSGLRPGTRLPDGLVGTSGFRFINEATPAAEIARVMGADPATVKQPIRVYGGMRHGATHEELAQKIFDEARELGAFERKHIMLYLPSGTGHVNPMPVAATEYLTHGDVASIGMQYYNKPSIMSFHKIGAATDLYEHVENKFLDHIRTLPADRRPEVVRYGESLGGISLLRRFNATGPAGVATPGIETKLVSVGTPGFSSFRHDAVGAGGYRLDATGTLFEFDHLKQLQDLSAAERAKLGTFLLTHYNDPVSKFTPALLVEPSVWLTSADRATGIPRKMKWVPGVTGIHGVIDTINGAHVTPGILERTGHDYRADLAPVMANVLGKRASGTQMENIVDSLNQLELARVNTKLPAFRFPRPEGVQ